MQSHVVQSPWNTIGIDLPGPLPKTRGGNTYILVVIDYFTKWVELFPLGCAKAKTIAQVLHDEVIRRHGVPVKIVSDNGAQFVAEIFRETLNILSIRHRTTALYHPQSNLSERVNRILKPMLAIFAQKDKQSWDIRLPQLALAIRAAINESTGQTPAFLMYGRELRLPLDLMYGPGVDSLDELRSAKEVRTYSKRQKAILESAYKSTRENVEIAQENQKLSYDSHRRNVKFSVAEKVLMANTAGSASGKWAAPKLAAKFVGPPYPITRKLGSLDYELVSEEDDAVLSPVHVERLRPYHE
ncbi:unnamed protein product [Didymodactylos carnosus]|uniref:Integrase catalytic domain-containing protein n=1 Tax=Didymodactylos carnosus TaxID=1234261 RepID=A0A8S2QBW2_9BILA|nr:unnamed protein product [Didymodactylos carnosus]CAF4094751.1 unnamed protein product [Didymodactylos carnosus]